jgi:hypothetical protein
LRSLRLQLHKVDKAEDRKLARVFPQRRRALNAGVDEALPPLRQFLPNRHRAKLMASPFLERYREKSRYGCPLEAAENAL